MVLEGDVAELAEGTPLLRAQINNYWSRGFESLRLRQELSWQKPTKHKDRQRSFFVFRARRVAVATSSFLNPASSRAARYLLNQTICSEMERVRRRPISILRRIEPEG